MNKLTLEQYCEEFDCCDSQEDLENLIKQIQEDAIKDHMEGRLDKVNGMGEGKRSYWRSGWKVGRTVYMDDKLIGIMDTKEQASLVCRAVNSYVPFGDDDTILECMSNDYQSMQKALVKIMEMTDHDSDIFNVAAESLPSKMV